MRSLRARTTPASRRSPRPRTATSTAAPATTSARSFHGAGNPARRSAIDSAPEMPSPSRAPAAKRSSGPARDPARGNAAAQSASPPRIAPIAKIIGVRRGPPLRAMRRGNSRGHARSIRAPTASPPPRRRTATYRSPPRSGGTGHNARRRAGRQFFLTPVRSRSGRKPSPPRQATAAEPTDSAYPGARARSRREADAPSTGAARCRARAPRRRARAPPSEPLASAELGTTATVKRARWGRPEPGPTAPKRSPAATGRATFPRTPERGPGEGRARRGSCLARRSDSLRGAVEARHPLARKHEDSRPDARRHFSREAQGDGPGGRPLRVTGRDVRILDG